MPINIRQKGAEGEREVARTLNHIINRTLEKLGLPQTAVDAVQRNQNQSAVGGNDLSGTFGISIEVKRQEALSVNTWWKQCCDAAARNHEVPVLIYRQNRKSWHVVLMTDAMLPGQGGSHAACLPVRSTISWEDFQVWFGHWVERKLLAGEAVAV